MFSHTKETIEAGPEGDSHMLLNPTNFLITSDGNPAVFPKAPRQVSANSKMGWIVDFSSLILVFSSSWREPSETELEEPCTIPKASRSPDFRRDSGCGGESARGDGAGVLSLDTVFLAFSTPLPRRLLRESMVSFTPPAVRSMQNVNQAMINHDFIRLYNCISASSSADGDSLRMVSR